MLLGVGLHEILWLALAIVIGGVITGLLAGLFGIGGGAVIVPVLYEVFRVIGVADEVRMQLCVGTSIAIILPTTIRSYLTHRAKGLVVPGVIRLWALPAVLGVACGAAIAAFAPAAVFKLAFVLIAGFIATKFLVAGDRWNLGADLPGPGLMRLYGFGIGLAGSLMGVSGGSLSNIVLTLYGKPIHNAVATSSGLGRADHHRRHARLHRRRMAAPGAAAAAVAWFRLADRRRGDGAGIEPDGAVRRAARPPAVAARARDRAELFPAADLAALPGQHALRFDSSVILKHAAVPDRDAGLWLRS